MLQDWSQDASIIIRLLLITNKKTTIEGIDNRVAIAKVDLFDVALVVVACTISLKVYRLSSLIMHRFGLSNYYSVLADTLLCAATSPTSLSRTSSRISYTRIARMSTSRSFSCIGMLYIPISMAQYFCSLAFI